MMGDFWRAFADLLNDLRRGACAGNIDNGNARLDLIDNALLPPCNGDDDGNIDVCGDLVDNLRGGGDVDDNARRALHFGERGEADDAFPLWSGRRRFP